VTILAAILVFCGLFFLTVSSVGIIRLPDFYTRTHAVGKSETLGAMLVIGGLAIYNGLELSTVKLLLMLLFIALVNPTATHVIARAAIRSALQPWVKGGRKESVESAEDRIVEEAVSEIDDSGKKA